METRAADCSFLGDLGFWVERTPVHEAAQRGETRQLQQLIESGACVNQVMVDSITPLHAASLQGQAQCVQLLLAAGAQVDARNIDGSTPLCDACASGSIECVKLLLSHGAKVNPPLYTASPLHEACMSGSSECVRLLIDVGANLEAHDCHFGTPLHVACAREHLDCVKMLLNAGANVNAAKLHETALHHAAKVKNVDLIEMLIQFGGNIYARDNRGRKPSDYTWSSSAPAKCLEHYEIVSLHRPPSEGSSGKTLPGAQGSPAGLGVQGPDADSTRPGGAISDSFSTSCQMNPFPTLSFAHSLKLCSWQKRSPAPGGYCQPWIHAFCGYLRNICYASGTASVF
ncbi:ankyrin repeat and SOCS box protein 13 isoform X2 [Eschrichtius robustus]|uniref:ankyrin repeat and SOCS box protein 13 isoform X2 n=1 Tax=Eschrichtius robustus TaxID=9764 RepID=UPI0035C12A54